MGRRVEVRDYIDLYEGLKKIPLENIIKSAKRKFGIAFDEKSFVGQLSYFEGLNFGDSVFINYRIPVDIFKKDLYEKAKKYINKK